MKTLAISLLSAICVLSIAVTATAEQLRTDPVITAIDAAIQSLRQQPNQFNLNVMAVGAMGRESERGTGINVEVHGGSSGSQTTGLIARADGTQVNIAQSAANAALKQEACFR